MKTKKYLSDFQTCLGRLDAARDQEEVDHLEVGQMAGSQDLLALAVFVELAARRNHDGILDHHQRIVVHGTAVDRDHDALVRGLIGLDTARKGMCQQLVTLVYLVAYGIQDLIKGAFLIYNAVFIAVLALYAGVICNDDKIQFSYPPFISFSLVRFRPVKKISGLGAFKRNTD